MMKKEDIEKLISMYKARPCLWRLNHEHYTNKHIKQKALKEILRALKPDYPDLDETAIKNKWQNLRCNYRKEIKKIKASERTAECLDDFYEPSIWYFKLLAFTQDQERPLKSISPLKSSIIGESEGSEAEKEDEELLKEERKQFLKELKLKKRRKNEVEKDLSSFMKTCTETISAPSSSTDDCSALGTYVAEKLRKMDDDQQIMAEALIQKVIIKGLKKQLTDDIEIVDTNLCFQQLSAEACRSSLHERPGSADK